MDIVANKTTLLDRFATKLHDDRMESPSGEVETFKENADEYIQQATYHIHDLYKQIEYLRGELAQVSRGNELKK